MSNIDETKTDDLNTKINQEHALLKDTITNAIGYISKLEKGMDIIVQDYRTGNEIEANRELNQIIEGFQWILQLQDNIEKMLKLDFSRYKHNDMPISERLNYFLNITKQILDAQLNEDWILLADLLEYEITPFLKEWQGILESFKNTIITD